MISESSIAVRYAETDKMGVVYHANYLVWFEIGRTRFLEEIGCPYVEFESRGLMSPVLKAEVEYFAPLHYGETALVRTRLIEMTAVRSVFQYEVFLEGDEDAVLRCSGKTTHCFVDKDAFKPLSMKRHAPELYQAYIQVLDPL